MVLNDLLHDRRVGQGRDVTKVVGMSGGNLAENSPHDFTRTGLRESGAKLKAGITGI